MPIKIGNAPCSWGVLEFDLDGKAAGYTQVLNELAETGYVGTELGDWGFMPTDPDALAAELNSRRLTMLGAFVPVAMKDRAAHAPGVEAALKVARLLRAAVDRTTGQDGLGWRPFLVLADNNGSDPFAPRTRAGSPRRWGSAAPSGARSRRARRPWRGRCARKPACDRVPPPLRGLRRNAR